MNGLVAEGLKWVGASVAALASIALISMTPPNLDMYPAPYPTDPNFLELREPRDPRRRFKGKREPRICYVESDEEPEDWAEERRSFHAHMLNRHGLKVRDFAFEQTLPPVPKAVQKRKEKRRGPQPLKRTRDMLEPTDTDVAGPSTQGASTSEDTPRRKRARLERRPTEPIPESQGMQPSSLSGFGDVPEGPSSQTQAPPSTPPAGSSSGIPTPPTTPHTVESAAPSQSQGTPSLRPRSEARRASTQITARRVAAGDDAMDVDEPSAGPSSADKGSAAMPAHFTRSLSRCSSLTSLSSAAPASQPAGTLAPVGRRPSLKDISSAYNMASATADTRTGAPQDRRSTSATPPRGASPGKRQGAARKTRSSAAKRAGGNPKVVPDSPRRSPRHAKGRQAARA